MKQGVVEKETRRIIRTTAMGNSDSKVAQAHDLVTLKMQARSQGTPEHIGHGSLVAHSKVASGGFVVSMTH